MKLEILFPSMTELNLKQGIEKTHFNVDNVDSYLKIRYNSQSLKKKLKE